MSRKFNEPTLGEIRASFALNSELARAIHPLMTWCQYEKHQAHTWALRLIKANPATGADAAAALCNLDSMIEGAKAMYASKPNEQRRYDAVLDAFNSWKDAQIREVAA